MGIFELFHRKKPELKVTPPGGTRRYVADVLDSLGWERTAYEKNYYQFKSPTTGHHITMVGPLDEELSDPGFENIWERLSEDRAAQTRREDNH